VAIAEGPGIELPPRTTLSESAIFHAKQKVDNDSILRYHSALSGHERTLNAMRRHPKPSNLRWVDVESLLLHLGAIVREGKGSAISVTLKGRTAYFHRPHPGDKADKGAITTALKLLGETTCDDIQGIRNPDRF
jgi:hypothetical protein